MNDGTITAILNSSTTYYPYNSSFSGKIVTDQLTPEELASILPADVAENNYSVIDVFEFKFTDARGSEFLPSCDVTYSVEYNLDETVYSSFLIYDTELGMYTPYSDATHFIFTVQKSGRFILVGEIIPETEAPQTTNGETSESGNSEITASTNPHEGNSSIITVLIITSIILIVIIAALVYTYVFKQYY